MRLDRYHLLAQLGAGCDGISYRAVAEDGTTAIEVRDLGRARDDAARWKQLRPRLRLAAGLQHPAAFRVVDASLDDESPFFALEWSGTSTMAAAFGTGGPKPLERVAALARTLAGVLEEAHRFGLAHSRLGPGQIVLVDGQPKLDFTGIDAGFPVGTASSRALDAACRDPRDADGGGPAADRAADLFSLGVLLVWLLTGEIGPTDRETRIARLDVAPNLKDLARGLLAEEPADRPSAREVRERLALPVAAKFQTATASFDVTGDWSEREPPPVSTVRPARSGKVDSLVAGLRLEGGTDARGTIVLEADPPRLGRYRLLNKLGEGGQGIVYRAEDPAQGMIVAIKVLRRDRADDETVLRRFRKEARLMAEANNPQVVNLLEFNEEEGLPYLVLEFVAGESLGRRLTERERLDESEALAIMAEVARGLMAAHERGIVHRDIKPSNILLLPPEGDGGSSVPRIKISDFGLARHVVDTESMALTAAGALLGTPHYMAPEQWTGRAVDPRTDVYAMGATLFHLLAGRPPFEGPTRDALAGEHCTEPPPPLSMVNPSVSEGVVRVVERALAKRPEDRYADAGAMLRDLEALIHGEPTGIPLHPILPACDPSRVLQFEFRWELESSPRQLWPLVTNTDRLDRAIGFPAVQYTTRYEEGYGVRSFAEGRKAGMVEIGEEHPYEWVESRRMGILREYSQGPFIWLVSAVELIPRPVGGTTLIHRLHLEPRNWKIRVGSRWGVGVGLRKRLETVYRRIDATVHGQGRRCGATVVDPFEEPEALPGPRRMRLERLLDRLSERGIDAAVVERLGEQVALGSAQEIARIRPIALAERFGLDPDQVVAACLHAAREGLLELHWDLLCPVCRISCQITDTLRAIAEHAHCVACHLDFQLDFANSIELIFRVHPEIREADLGTYCIGGPSHSPHVPAQVRVAPRERFELALELSEGSYRLRGPQLPWTVDFSVRGSTGLRRCEIDLSPGRTPEPPTSLRAGSQVLILNNEYDREVVIRVERSASRGDALTAARATTLALFRELFPDEVLAPGQLATVSMVTFLVTALDANQADELYQALGDARAFGVIHEHFRRLGDAIRKGGGAVVKTQGEGMIASFGDVTAAVRTALELPARLAEGEATRSLRLRVGVHRGPTLAATLNDQLDYFGTTARQAAGTLQYAQGGEMILTQVVAADPEVAALLNERGIETTVVPANLGWQTHMIRLLVGNCPPS
jgi:serine/threonine protein kinase/class 3 adenylate cyclase